MRWEYINWDSAFYFNPKGKTRKARRPVPLSDRVIALLRIIQHEQFGRADGWVFPSKKSRSGHIELSGIGACSEKLLVSSASRTR
jgi:integrase